MTPAAQKTLLVRALPAEHWLSIDLYHQNISEALAAYSDKVELHSCLPDESCDVSWSRRQRLRYLGYPATMRRALSQAPGMKVAHILDQSYSHLVGIAPRTIVTCHDIAEMRVSNLPWRTRMLWDLRIRKIRHAYRVVAISHNTAKDLMELLELPPEKIVVNYYGVDKVFGPRPAAAQAVAARWPAQNARTANTFPVVHVGSNILRKNIPTLLRAFALLRSRTPHAVLLKIGDNLDQDGFTAMIDSLGVRDAIVNFGKVKTDELVDIYNVSGALAFPSLYEGFGRPVLEAQACGLPCVLARTSSLPEVGGDAALYHEALDHEQMAAQLQTLAEDRDLRRRISEASIANAARFSWDRHAQGLMALYDEAARDMRS